MSAETTLPLADEDAADEAWRYWREQFRLLGATGDLELHVRIEGGSLRRGTLAIKQQLQPGGKRRQGP